MNVQKRIEENFWVSLATIAFFCIATTTGVVWAILNTLYSARIDQRDQRIATLDRQLAARQSEVDSLK